VVIAKCAAFPQTSLSIHDLIGSPILLPSSSHQKRQVKLENVVSKDRSSPPLSSAFLDASPSTHQKRQVKLVNVVSRDRLSSPLSSAFLDESSSSNQVLGILQPLPVASRGNDILSELLPEFIEISNKLEKSDLLRSESSRDGRAEAAEIVQSFMPIMRKLMSKNADEEGRSLTPQELDAIAFAEKSVGPFVKFAYDVSNYGKGFTHPGLSKTDLPTDLSAEMMVDLLPELTRFVLQIKNRYGGWPGADSAVEVMNLFLPFARRVVESRAKLEGRFVTKKEQAHLRFNEETMPILLKYSEEAFKSGRSLEAAEKYNIIDVVQKAWEKLNDSSF